MVNTTTNQIEITAADFGLREDESKPEPECRVFGERVAIPTFEIVDNPTIRLADLRSRRYNVVNRAREEIHQEYEDARDNLVFAAIDRLATRINSNGDSFDLGCMANPIRRNLDYQGIARRVFPVEPTPRSAALIYSGNLVPDIDDK